jgi:hypothetical protein
VEEYPNQYKGQCWNNNTTVATTLILFSWNLADCPTLAFMHTAKINIFRGL